MKVLKYFSLAVVSLIFVTFNSCSLDETILDTPTPATAKSETDVTAIIQGMYSRFNDSGMFKYLGHIMITSTADDIFCPDAASDNGPYGQRTYNSANTAPMWNGMYNAIANANNLIETLDNLTLSPAFEKRGYGEAYFIRAFCYYYLVRLYGGVPLRTTATKVDSDFYIPRSTVDQTYAQIFADFKRASERLPAKGAIPVEELGRANKGSAQALLAQAYLTYGDQLILKGQDGTPQFQNSVIYADSVISTSGYTLLTNYGELFEIAKETSAYNEVIFGIRFQTDGQNRAQPAAGSEFAPKFGATNTYGISAEANTNGTNIFRVSHWFADMYRRGDYSNGISTFTPNIDYRNEKAFFQRGINTTTGVFRAVYPNIPGSTVPGSTSDLTINDPLIAKYIDPTGKDNRNHGNDLFIIRMAEVYLIKAEALNEISGAIQAALDAFNVVRKRARTVDGVPEARTVPANLTLAQNLTKDQFRLKIFHERGLELIGESQRWFDLVRMRSPNRANQTMYEYQLKDVLTNTAVYPRILPTGFNANTGLYTVTPVNAVYAPILNIGGNVTNLNGITGPKFILFPIPNTELQQNIKFGPQNTGW